MKKLKTTILIILTVLGLSAALTGVPVGAAAPFSACDTSAGKDSTICASKSDSLNPFLKTGVNVMFILVGALAVIMIIYSGIQYVISAGDSGKVAKAKNTLTYSIVGLIIAFLAYAIVNWIMAQFAPKP